MKEIIRRCQEKSALRRKGHHRAIKFSLKNKCVLMYVNKHIYTHTDVHMFHLNSKVESNE